MVSVCRRARRVARGSPNQIESSTGLGQGMDPMLCELASLVPGIQEVGFTKSLLQSVERSAKRMVRGCEKFLPVVA